jgi:hypothetical protein
MKNSLHVPFLVLFLTALALPPPSHKFSIDWYTIDGGGGISSGGGFEVAGTIGQHDAGTLSGGSFKAEGGFWPGIGAAGGDCLADLDGNGTLDLFDFLEFANLFNAEDPAADCTGEGVFDLFAFLCFVNLFNDGC